MNKSETVVYMTLAFLIYTIGRSPDQNFELPPSNQLAAWALLVGVLAILVDIDETTQLADALVILLLVAILLAYGENVIKWVNRKIGNKPDPTAAKIANGQFPGKVVPL